MDGKFWLIVTEVGCVPERKGPWLSTSMASILREFMTARPTALLTVLTVSDDKTPDVQHGPEALQMLDARSMQTASRHNQRVRAAFTLAKQTPAPKP